MEGKNREPGSPQRRTLHIDFVVQDGRELCIFSNADTGAVIRTVPVPSGEVRNG